MSTEAVMSGQIERAGEGRFELVKVHLDLDDEARERLTADAAGTIQAFLESQGNKVNRVVIHDATPEALAESDWHHVMFPDEMMSSWTQM